MGSTSSPLELNPETMRELGYRVVDVLVERIAGLEGQVAWRPQNGTSSTDPFGSRRRGPEAPSTICSRS